MLSLFTLFALSAAAYRATRLVVDDTIAQPFRDTVELWHARKHESRIRVFVRDLFSCPFCIGFWLSATTVLVHRSATGWSGKSLWVTAIEVWAVAGLQALLSGLDNSWKD